MTRQEAKAVKAARHAREEVAAYPGRRQNARIYKRDARRAERRLRKLLARSCD